MQDSKLFQITMLIMIIAIASVVGTYLWQKAKTDMKIFELQEKTENLENELKQVREDKEEIERQYSEQLLEIEELQDSIAELKGEERGIEINQTFTVLGRTNYMKGTRKELTVTIESVEKSESLKHLEEGIARNIGKESDEIFMLVYGKLTNKEKVDLYIKPEDWLRLFDAEKEELYAPKSYWAYTGVPAEATQKFKSPVIFAISRSAAHLYLRVEDSDGNTTPIELDF